MAGKTQRALVAEATTLLEELAEGDIDDERDVLASIEELLAALSARQKIRADLEAARDSLSRPRSKRKAKAKPAPRRKAPRGARPRSDAERVGGEDPFELTHTYAGEVTRVASLRMHMRFFFRVPKRALLEDVAALYDELVATHGPFDFIGKTTTRGFSKCTGAALSRARARFACPKASSCYIELKRSELADDVATASVRVAAHPRGSTPYTSCPSELQVTADPTSADDAFRNRFIEVCGRLPDFASATAGHYLDVSIAGHEPEVIARVLDSAMQHPGAELPGGTLWRQTLAPGWIAGVNWLTGLSAATVDALGGASRLKRNLPAGCTIHRVGDRAVIEVVDGPQLEGDGKAPPTYAGVAQALETPKTLFGLPLAFAAPQADAWQRRLL